MTHSPSEVQPQRTGQSELLRLENVTKQFGGREVVSGVSLSVVSGEVVSVIGPSGAGKSTVLRCINFLAPPDSGQILLNGSPVIPSYRPGHRPRTKDLTALRRKIGMVFQNFELFPHLTIRRNVALAQAHVLGRSREMIERRTTELLDRVGLGDKADMYPAQCSGGQQQRVAIARALALDPEVMLFDEPTSALDPELGAEVLLVMRQLAQDGMTMIVVTHEMHFAMQVSDQVMVMADGHVIESGRSEEVFKNPRHERTRRFLHAVLDR